MKTNVIFLQMLGLLATVASADLITGLMIHSATTNPWNPEVMGPEKAINGEGLPGDEPALSGTHGFNHDQHWWSYPFNEDNPAQITIDLNDTYTVSKIQIWNYNERSVTHRSTQNVEIFVAPNSDPLKLVKLSTNGTGLHDNGSGDFLFPQAPGVTTYEGFRLDLTSLTDPLLLTRVRLIRFKPLDSYDNNAGVGLAEVQFGGKLAPGHTLLLLR